MSLNAIVLLTESARRTPDRPAIVSGGARLSYRELNAASSKVANALRSLGVQCGDKVAMMMPNVPEFAIIYYGILKLGGAVVPLNALYRAAEVHQQLSDSDSRAFFVWEALAGEASRAAAGVDACRHLIVVNSPGSNALPERAISFEAMLAIGSSTFDIASTMADDTAAVFYSTGPDGAPRGAEISHFNLFYNAVITADQVLQLNSRSVGLTSLPLSQPFGQSCLLNALLYAGGTVSLPEPDAGPGDGSTDARLLLDTAARDEATYLLLSPGDYHRLLRLRGGPGLNLPSLRLSATMHTVGSAGLMKNVAEHTGSGVVELFGYPETSPLAAYSSPGGVPADSFGTPIWGSELRLLNKHGELALPGEDAEILIRGHNVMKGYLNNQPATDAAMHGGWLSTGTMVRLDDGGDLQIVAEKNGLIRHDGYAISPRELEAVLQGHPAVADVRVVGVENKDLGEDLKALLVLKAKASATAGDIIAYCSERVAPFKCPRYVEFTQELPPSES